MIKLTIEVDKVPVNFTGMAEFASGNKYWYKEGKFHREDGPAFECANGSKEWYKNGILHRDNGPAIEYANGKKYWYKDGKLHRLDGPAIEYADGAKSWYIDGKAYWLEDFNKKITTCDGKIVQIDGKSYKLTLTN